MFNVLPLPTTVADSTALDALSTSRSSILLISCKEDNPPQLRQVDLDFNEQIRSRFNKVETCSTSANVPESQKRCISIILRSILRCRKGKHHSTTFGQIFCFDRIAAQATSGQIWEKHK
jgi:hypothetical protein